MNTNGQSLFLLSLLVLSLLYFPYKSISETPCPYPCYPPPIGGGSSTPSMTQPPPYFPPTVNNPSPAGILPNDPPPAGSYPSPPFNMNGGDGSDGSLYGPPPPNAIFPYFPYYFRKPPHQTDETSSSSFLAVPGKLSVMIVAVATLVLVGNILFIISM